MLEESYRSQLKGISRFSVNFLISGRILPAPVDVGASVFIHLLRLSSGVVSEQRRAAGEADQPDRGRSGPVRAADGFAAWDPLHRDGGRRHWPRRGRSKRPHQPSE